METSSDPRQLYRQVSYDIRNGLKNIYQQLSSISEKDKADIQKNDALFNEASDQLKEVVKATESAAMSIMDTVENQLDKTHGNSQLLSELQQKYGDDALLRQLKDNNTALAADLTGVLTNLGFQDITGQRIKKVMQALASLENSIVDLYLSSGLILDGVEKCPHKDAETLQKEARKAVDDFHDNKVSGSVLKGPSSTGISQTAIDDMLSQLGL